ncbi:MAG: hypothetical protein RMJ36_01325 [Candidatus Calescibacterium sp.]|nr:hypothetical protein [Candidatus Calescibacterium sp.]MDW8132281.1 hypothetical protein [Candidatus Calescibacterium sp.]
MFDLQSLQKLIKNYVPSIIYQTSSKIAEYKNPVVNYHPQSDDKYYQGVLPSKLEIREFLLDQNKEAVTQKIKELIFVDQKNGNGDYRIDSINNKQNQFIERLLKFFPTKAFIINTDHTVNILSQYDKVKEEVSNFSSNLSNIKPGTILYYAISTAYNVEKNVVEWSKNAQENFFGSINIDLFGKNTFKGFMENASYNPVSNFLSLGTFVSYKDNKVFNASKDSDVVIHEVGHAILDRLRPFYIDSVFHLETSAVHEAFSDINSFLFAAMDENINVSIDEIDKPNAISSIAESFGTAFYTQFKIEQQILNEDPFTDFQKISVNTPLREMTSLVEYKPYNQLTVSEKEEHKYSLSLSTTFYKAFSEYVKDVGDIKKAAKEFFKVFVMGTKISPLATTTMPEFYKSLIVADILYNNSNISNYLIKAANSSKLLNSSLDDIKLEIEKSKNVDVSILKEKLANYENSKDIEKAVIDLLKNYSSEFSIIEKMRISVVPNFDGGISIEGVYTYPIGLDIDGKDFPVYGGVLLVFDKNLNLVYSNIEKPSIEKLSYMKDYSKYKLKKD